MKKSFVLYHDTCEVFDKLTDEQAGQLIKEIVKSAQTTTTHDNPQQPSGLSGLMEVIFIPFKAQLVRDAEKWAIKAEANKSNGKLGGRPKKENPTKPNVTQPNPKKGVTVSGSVSDTVNVSEDNINIYTSFDEFWENYPRQRRGNKQKALKAFDSALQRDTNQNILQGLADYILSSEVEKGFAKGAEAWLNNDGWSNEYFSTPAKKDINHYVTEALGDIENGSF